MQVVAESADKIKTVTESNEKSKKEDAQNPGDKVLYENNNVKTYDHIKGNVAVGSFDFTFNRYNIIARGNVDYGYVGNAATISDIKRNNAANNAPYQKTPVGKNAISIGVEAGYDVFSQVESMHSKEQKLYVFGHYEYYNSYMPAKQQPPYE